MAYKRYKTQKFSLSVEPNRRLALIINGALAGWLREHPGRYWSFAYEPEYDGPDVSVCMSRANGDTFGDLDATPWLHGLLPDSGAVRTSMAKGAGVAPNDLFGLLAEYGRDCPGAVQICEETLVDDVLNERGGYVRISDSEIRARLEESMDEAQPRWQAEEEHWSLGGNQGKIALAFIDGNWFECTGSSPTTHILKPGVNGMPLQALVEFATMRLSELLGIPTAHVEYCDFDGVEAIAVERYDRVVNEGKVVRLHQEDLCQALRFLPSDKYDVSTDEAMSCLRDFTDQSSVERFAEALFFNYLIGGVDAHAKNYSLLHLAGSTVLAPLYDLASVLPYRKVTSRKYRKMPMSIGGNKRIGALTGEEVSRFAMRYQLDERGCKVMMESLAREIPEHLDAVEELMAEIPNGEEVARQLSRTVNANCDAMLRNLERTRKTFLPWKLAVINGGELPRSREV